MDTQDTFARGYDEAVAARRLMNDSIASSAERLGEDRLFEFFCECAELGCKKVARLTVEQFRLCRSGAVLVPADSHDQVAAPLAL